MTGGWLCEKYAWEVVICKIGMCDQPRNTWDRRVVHKIRMTGYDRMKSMYHKCGPLKNSHVEWCSSKSTRGKLKANRTVSELRMVVRKIREMSFSYPTNTLFLHFWRSLFDFLPFLKIVVCTLLQQVAFNILWKLRNYQGCRSTRDKLFSYCNNPKLFVTFYIARCAHGSGLTLKWIIFTLLQRLRRTAQNVREGHNYQNSRAHCWTRPSTLPMIFFCFIQRQNRTYGQVLTEQAPLLLHSKYCSW